MTRIRRPLLGERRVGIGQREDEKRHPGEKAKEPGMSERGECADPPRARQRREHDVGTTGRAAANGAGQERRDGGDQNQTDDQHRFLTAIEQQFAPGQLTEIGEGALDP